MLPTGTSLHPKNGKWLKSKKTPWAGEDFDLKIDVYSNDLNLHNICRGQPENQKDPNDLHGFQDKYIKDKYEDEI